ncbi:low-specificity L-threonine aldolase [Alkalimarinus sediminis]|uniref:Low-specificity L-threonine aldolase n=1 Tax=Alkalimarinus sediminis TaxID=1632866 RepID=A0A9E8HIZ8_9ALTE|nr:low-specificity L-threonine aldolase [Alkalimarinus sediminis]UZW73591.1 low-specificity L-threonine aldolase [Alkalimarinus sediminis]
MIDFRSDTVTHPSPEMRAFMANARVGDDVFGDDPTVNALEMRVAKLLGLESAMLVPSGTQSNLIALLTHCGRGDEYIVGQDYHTYKYEAGGAASLGSIQPQPLAVSGDGTLDLDMVKKTIKPNDFHFAKTRLLALENTHSGKIISNDYLNQASRLARDNGLYFHLDGARVFNAAVAQNISVKEITSQFDSVSVCCSKGLGAPIGSLLCGSESFINTARRWRKMVGGGMRQAGILAAAIDFALSHNIERLKDDHDNARYLAELLSTVPSIRVESPHTNMLYIELENAEVGAELQQALATRGILISSGRRVRLVTHLDIDMAAIERFVAEVKTIL